MNRNLSFFIVLCFAMNNVSQTLRADEPTQSALQPVPAQTAIASDRNERSAAEVAREVLRLQQQLGGSIVEDRVDLRDLPEVNQQPWHHGRAPDTTLLTWPADQALATDRRSTHPPLATLEPSRSKIVLLRETARLLDTRAHHLEELDLYDQADALRAVATRLRHDAREMKGRGISTDADLPKSIAPSSALASPGDN